MYLASALNYIFWPNRTQIVCGTANHYLLMKAENDPNYTNRQELIQSARTCRKQGAIKMALHLYQEAIELYEAWRTKRIPEA